MRRITIAGVKRRSGRALVHVAKRLGAVPTPPQPEEFPAGFLNWTRRRSNRLKGDFPARWRPALAERVSTGARVCVVMHVFYPELVGQLIDELAHIPTAFDLIVTNATGSELRLPPLDRTAAASAIVLDVANVGRDILPLVSVVNAGLLDPYELVLKVHTKKSAWREDHAELEGSGEQWRTSLLANLLGDSTNVGSVLNAFAEDPVLGVLTADDSVKGAEFWGGDRLIVDSLLRRLQLPGTDDLRFASGSMYWARGFVLQGLRALDLSAADFEPETGQVDGTAAHAVERIIGILTREAGLSTRERSTIESVGDGAAAFSPASPRRSRARVVPFYLPQFHRFPENDQWWGEGFTEWSNVAAATPLYPGHNQPLLPSDLGFYDLADDDVRARQFALARPAGIEGFMYYYYWFAGRKLMQHPVESLIASDDDVPFCIMWANENFTRRWDGSERDILIGQDYDRVPATQFIHDVLPLLLDGRYMRVGGHPVLAVYRITQIPDHLEVIAYWRRVVQEAGLGDLHLVTVDVGGSMQGVSGAPSEHGLDATLEFAPHNMLWSAQDRGGLEVDPRFEGNMMNYGEMARAAEATLADGPEPWRYPGVMVNFDNTARRQWVPDIWYGSNPYTFRRWLDAAVAAVADRPADERLVFINAWNEWAEGAVLEPSQRFGSTYLLAVRDALVAP